MTSPIRIVIVEDPIFGEAIAQHAASADMSAHVVLGEAAALLEVARTPPDAIVLGGDEVGAICRSLREHTDAPIVAVLASLRPDARIDVLDAGADDVVTRAIHLSELAARVRAHVRRARGELRTQKAQIAVGSVTVQTATRTASVEGIEVQLSMGEYLALVTLNQMAGRPISRDQLLRVLHGADDGVFDRSIDVVISRLRAKLGSEARRLKTVRGVGYMLVDV